MAVALLLSLSVPIALSVLFFPFILATCGQAAGWYICKKTQQRRDRLLQRVAAEEASYVPPEKASPNLSSEDEDWEKVGSHLLGSAKGGAGADANWNGIIGFFHPFCNAGGGGERVLWAAIRATQKRWPRAVCVVYTGDHDASKSAMLKSAQDRFNIKLHPPTLHFLYLSTRRCVLSSYWPHFTLLGQSLGSMRLACDAFTLLVPDIFIDTMGYAFALWLSALLFPAVPTAAYVHYPTISTDMLSSLDAELADSHEPIQGINAGKGRGWKGRLKRKYWQLFAKLYSRAGGSVDVVMTNSSWTQGHIQQLWGSVRERKHGAEKPCVVYPPVAVKELEREALVDEETEAERGPFLLYIAQFRPEKNHELILRAFSELLSTQTWAPVSQEGGEPSASARTSLPPRPKLILIGSVRDNDDATRVYNLRLLAHELKIRNDVEFICDAPWPQILHWLRHSSIGVNGMWNEHFGIGVVEYQAAGLIGVVNNSGGPKMDIVVEMGGEPTGYHATTTSNYAAAFAHALSLPLDARLAMRRRAQESARRFTEEAFARKWLENMEKLIVMQQKRARAGADGQ